MNTHKIPASDGTSVNQEFFVLHFQTCTMLLCMVWCNFVLYRVIHLPSCIHLLIIIRRKRNLTVLLPWRDFPDHITKDIWLTWFLLPYQGHSQSRPPLCHGYPATPHPPAKCSIIISRHTIANNQRFLKHHHCPCYTQLVSSWKKQ